MKKFLEIGLLSSIFGLSELSTGFAQTSESAAAPVDPPALKVSVSVDTGFTANPDSPKDEQNFGLPFTDRPNTPILNSVLLTAERSVDPEKDYSVGVKFQGMYGSDARLTHFLGIFDLPSGKPRNQFDIVEANASIHTPWLGQGGTDIKAGFYATPLGYEVIDPNGNTFYSHSYIYNFGLPLKHTGVLATTHANATLDVWYGVDTGANTTFGTKGDANSAAGFLAGIGLNGLADGKVTVLALTHIGAESSRLLLGAAANATLRYFSDIVIAAKLSNRLTWITELNWIRDDAPPVSNGYGVAQYLIYAVSDTVSVAARAELWRDAQGFFVGNFPGNNDFVLAQKGLPNGSNFPGKSTYGEVTLGLTWKPAVSAPLSSFAIRPEIRYDGSLSGRKAYNAFTKASQFTAAVDLIVKF